MMAIIIIIPILLIILTIMLTTAQVLIIPCHNTMQSHALVPSIVVPTIRTRLLDSNSASTLFLSMRALYLRCTYSTSLSCIIHHSSSVSAFSLLSLTMWLLFHLCNLLSHSFLLKNGSPTRIIFETKFWVVSFEQFSALLPKFAWIYHEY